MLSRSKADCILPVRENQRKRLKSQRRRSLRSLRATDVLSILTRRSASAERFIFVFAVILYCVRGSGESSDRWDLDLSRRGLSLALRPYRPHERDVVCRQV